jgi:hypothetical protein
LTLLDAISLVYTVDCYFPDTEAECEEFDTTINEIDPHTTEELETEIPKKKNQTEVDVETEMENSTQVVDEEVKNPEHIESGKTHIPSSSTLIAMSI